MADAKKEVVTTVRPPVVEYDRKIVVSLFLSEDEAKFLADILAKVGGASDTSRRRHQRPITAALQSVGFDWRPEPPDIYGNISFK
jgi:hypothetical protein